MKFSAFGLLATLAATVAAQGEDLLFVDTLLYDEYDRAIALGYTAKVVTKAEWRAMTTEDFAQYKAIVLSDPDCSLDVASIDFAEETKDIWSPAVLGNIVVLGTYLRQYCW